MAKKKGRASSTSNRTIDSVSFDVNHIDDVIASIQLDDKLKHVKVSHPPNQPRDYTLELVVGDLKLHFVDIAVMGKNYFAWFNPQLDEYKEKDKEFYEKHISPAYKRLKQILYSYAKKEVREYMEKTTPENSE